MTSRSLKIRALVAIAPYFSTYHSTLSSPSRCSTSHESWVSRWVVSLPFPTHCSHTSVLGAVTQTSDLQALCRAVLEEAAVCVVVGARCAGSPCETSQLSPLTVLFCPAGPQAAVSPRFCVPSHRLAFAVADVSGFFSQLPHAHPSSSSWFGSLILANSKYAKACLPGFLQNILGSLCAGLDPLSNSFCTLYPILAGCL